MAKAFIFDLDGVLIDDERIWEDKKQSLYLELFGKEVADKLGSTLGINMDSIYDRALAAGANIDKQSLLNAFYNLAEVVYRTAPIPKGIEELVKALKEWGYRIAIVSASPLDWITTTTKRLPFENDIELIISLHERPDLKHKPFPDGYTEAMRVLEASPDTTIILEDSNSGIASAKASGAYAIGLKQNLVEGYSQHGADAYADKIESVVDLVRRHSGGIPESQLQ